MQTLNAPTMEGVSVATDAPRFSLITELPGDAASVEQMERAHRRYRWAGSHAAGRDVLEVACGVGQGLGYLASVARSVRGGDISEELLALARRHYGDRIPFDNLSAESLPYADGSFDVILIFEAIYYLTDIPRFVAEARRVLRPEGVLLIVTANKDLFDFTPSPFSTTYLGVRELAVLLRGAGFRCAFYGDSPIAASPGWQRFLRPVKRVLSRSGLMPKGKFWKGVLKRIVFGRSIPLPAELEIRAGQPVELDSLDPDRPAHSHKVIFCEATRD